MTDTAKRLQALRKQDRPHHEDQRLGTIKSAKAEIEEQLLPYERDDTLRRAQGRKVDALLADYEELEDEEKDILSRRAARKGGKQAANLLFGVYAAFGLAIITACIYFQMSM